jgi:4-amino-4-deoxy-L-arabinose transferase-like glycosyltransferase
MSTPSEMPRTDDPRQPWSPVRLALAIGAAAGLAVVLTLGDPGLTTDEPLDVRPGRTYVATLRARGLAFFERSVVDHVFRDNAEHPPLGRWLLGIASTLGQPFEILLLGPDPLGLYILSGRLAPALAFAVLAGLVVHASARRYGTTAGLAAGFSLVVMPRVFAHAHFGALDTFIGLFWTLSLLAADRALTGRRPVLAMAGAGAVWSLALLTKIHAWFLIPVVLVWTIARLGRSGRAVGAFTAWAAGGLGLFVIGWPWLWYDTVSRLREYLITSVERTSIQVQYLGQVYADHDVPWHYPWVYFAVTVPVGLQILGLLGLARGLRKWRDDLFPLLLAGSIGLFLVVFSTRIPVYDGERLFLVVFPLWAMLIGHGFALLWEGLHARKWVRGGLIAIVIGQGYGVLALHPFGLSYYNMLIGGLPGAERLGMELTYWGDAVDRVLLDRLVKDLPPESTAALVPTLYPGQGIMTTTRAMARRPILLGDQETAFRSGWLVISRRTAYWRPELRPRLARGRAVFERRRQGVWLSAIYSVPAGNFNAPRPRLATSPNVQGPSSQ